MTQAQSQNTIAEGPVFVTGVAGFIGFHTARRLLAEGRQVVGYDNVNDYYDVELKRARLAALAHENFYFVEADLADAEALDAVFAQWNFGVVIHLAAQAGVRYSLDNPGAYVQSNLVGFANILESCRYHGVKHLAYASSSSVYGSNTSMPFGEGDAVDHPVSLYAATKKSNEMMAHSYAHLYNLPCTGMRFFTVYGPWGRPDMAYFSFTQKILAGEPIRVFGKGELVRDFTYVDDIVDAILAIAAQPAMANSAWSSAQPHAASSQAPWRIYNLGNGQPVTVNALVRALEAAFETDAVVEYAPMQPGDVVGTHADTSALVRDFDMKPRVALHEGIPAFARWYRDYYVKKEQR